MVYEFTRSLAIVASLSERRTRSREIDLYRHMDDTPDSGTSPGARRR
jgi:hypothetical protein